MGIRVEVREGDSLAVALQRFNNYVRTAHVMQEYKWHAEFTKPCAEIRRRAGNAKLRAQGHARKWAEKQRRREADSRFL